MIMLQFKKLKIIASFKKSLPQGNSPELQDDIVPKYLDDRFYRCRKTEIMGV